jgi:hypothetical protein
MNIQHPYSGIDKDTTGSPLSTGDGAYVGYFGPFKASELASATSLDMEPVQVPRGDDRHKVSLLGGVSRLRCPKT